MTWNQRSLRTYKIQKENHCLPLLASLCAAVVNLKTKTWINPDGDEMQSVIDTVRKCPSGALSYSIDDVEYRDQEKKPMVTVSKNGPYIITGGIELIGDTHFAEGASKEHYTLCRCGA